MVNEKQQEIVVSLISHTNVGKTSLARTLLRQDVGDVKDQTHVTDQSEAYVFLESDHAVLKIWDTPGFGDVRGLLDRVKREGGATRWLLHHVVDRFRNRALFCSVEALKSIRASVDLILYLAQANEDPEMAVYPQKELELLAYFKKPVLLVLNQVDCLDASRDWSEYVKRWKTFLGAFPHVVDVLVLDAFHPLPKHEEHLLRAISQQLDVSKKPAAEDLINTYFQAQNDAAKSCIEAAWAVFSTALDQKQPFSGDEQADLTLLQGQLARHIGEYTQTLMNAFNISIADQTRIQAELGDLHERLQKLPEKQAGMWGGLVSGALSGLSADLLSGGLSFGGGALLGGISGWVAGFYGTKGFNALFRRGTKNLRWSDAFLGQLMVLLAALFLRVRHHGRAKGVLYFGDAKETEYWLEKLEAHASKTRSVLAQVRKPEEVREGRELFVAFFETLIGL